MKREAKIGIFLTGTFLILSVFIFIVGDLSVLFKKPGYSLHATFGSTAGLEKRAAVKLAGVQIGYVKDIQLVKMQARVRMTIYPHIEIPKDSRVTFSTVGLIGEKSIEILPGSSSAMCREGDFLEGLPSASFDQIGSLLFSLSKQVSDVGDSIKDLIGEKERADFKEILENFASMTSGFNEFLSLNKEEAGRTIQHASQTLQNFDQKMKEVAQHLDTSVLLLKDMAEENRENIRLNLEKLKDLMAKIEESVRLLNDTLEKMSKGKGTLGKLINESDLYTKMDGTIEDVRKTVRPFSTFRATVDVRADYYAKSEFVKAGFSLSLNFSSNKYFIAQVIRDPWSSRYTYSALAGGRWGNISPRAGLIESEFGFGLDYYALDDRWVFGFEGFNFNRHPRPRFRLTSLFFPSRQMYLVLGVDDFTLAANREFFFGLGFRLR